MESTADILQYLEACSKEMKRLYWTDKDLPACLRLGKEGIARGEAAAAQSQEDAAEILVRVKPLCYDLASFSWIGWDEPGIHPTDADAVLGLEAARKNLKYAIELQRGDLPTSMAHWVLGAHFLTSGRSDEAVEEFVAAENFANAAGANGEAELAVGFALLARAGHTCAGLEDLASHITIMEADSDAAPFVGQIRTAAAVIGITLADG